MSIVLKKKKIQMSLVMGHGSCKANASEQFILEIVSVGAVITK